MTENQEILDQLQKLLTWKKSKAFVASKLGVTELELEELIKQLNKEEEPLESTKKVNNDKGTIESSLELDFEPKSDEDLYKLHKINPEKYKISTYWSKMKSNGKFTSSVFATLIRIDSDLISQKEVLLKELRDASEYKPYKFSDCKGIDRRLAYEVNIPDVHFGKMSWGEESGEDYDLRIAEERYKTAISELISYINPLSIEKIIFPIGNDMINIDSRRNETFAGTPQDSDSRFYKIVKTVKSILIRAIDGLSLIAPVDVIVVSGNHDTETMFMIGEMLDAYYHNNSNVNIDNSPKQRKYYRYGVTGFQYTHGNEEKHHELGLIFATEESRLWADTTFRICKLGHFHKNKKTEYVSVDEHQGFQVQILPSLSGSDAWHKSKGYMSKKQAKGFLYDKHKGQIGEFTYSV